MKVLDEILNGLTDVDYGYRCLMQIIDVLEEQASNEGQIVVEQNLYIINKNIKDFQQELQGNIDKLDKYIMSTRQ